MSNGTTNWSNIQASIHTQSIAYEVQAQKNKGFNASRLWVYVASDPPWIKRAFLCQMVDFFPRKESGLAVKWSCLCWNEKLYKISPSYRWIEAGRDTFPLQRIKKVLKFWASRGSGLLAEACRGMSSWSDSVVIFSKRRAAKKPFDSKGTTPIGSVESRSRKGLEKLFQRHVNVS